MMINSYKRARFAFSRPTSIEGKNSKYKEHKPYSDLKM